MVAPLIGAAAIGFGGSILSGLFGAKGQSDANKANLKIARENREFQERMSNTAVKRRMDDLANSGINPLLAGRYDASTPPGNIATMGSVEGAGVEAAGKGAGAALTALQTGLLKAQKAKIEAETGKTIAETKFSGQALKNEGLRYIGLETSNAIRVVELQLQKLNVSRARTFSEFFDMVNQGSPQTIKMLGELSRAAGRGAGAANVKLRELIQWAKSQMGRLPTSDEIDRAAGGRRFGERR